MDPSKKLTCISCRLLFSTLDEQVIHYKGELHRFNLKRKVVNLPPVTQEQFDLKVEQVKKEEEAQVEQKSIQCTACKKTFLSENQYTEHVKSKKHKELAKGNPDTRVDRVRKAEPASADPGASSSSSSDRADDGDDAQEVDEGDEDEDVDAPESDPIPPTACLFCSEEFESVEVNVEHMISVHSFYIPDREYLSNMEGLITYLGEKVGVGNVCLKCNGRGRSFFSTEAVQMHMRKLAHCKMMWEDNEGEYEDFFDYSSMPKLEVDEYGEPIVPFTVSDDGTSITFADGRTIGHRSMLRYHKQKFTAPETGEAVDRNRAINQHRMIGWGGNDHAVSEISKRSQRIQSRDGLQLGVRHNWLHRFRCENVVARNSGR